MSSSDNDKASTPAAAAFVPLNSDTSKDGDMDEEDDDDDDTFDKVEMLGKGAAKVCAGRMAEVVFCYQILGRCWLLV